MSSNSGDNPLSEWDRNRNRITSNKGGWRIGEAVYNQGFSQLEELVGHVSYFQLMLLNVTGRLPDKRIAIWLENTFSCASWPDSRIWCNQMGALAGSAQASAVAGTAAGVLASDSVIYGPGVIGYCTDFIQQALQAYNSGISVPQIVTEQLDKKGSVPGYARPIAKGDERVVAMRRVSRNLDFELGEHERLAILINDYLSEHHDECINVGGYMVAFLSDQGFSTKEAVRMTTLIVAAGVQACHAEMFDKPAGTYLPMRCEDINYVGVDDRELPPTP